MLDLSELAARGREAGGARTPEVRALVLAGMTAELCIARGVLPRSDDNAITVPDREYPQAAPPPMLTMSHGPVIVLCAPMSETVERALELAKRAQRMTADRYHGWVEIYLETMWDYCEVVQ